AGARAAAGVADLLLRGRDRRDLRDRPVAREQAQRLRNDERADPVVNGPAHYQVVRQLHGLAVDHARVADADAAGQRGGAVARADVEPQVLDLARLLALLLLDHVDRLLADHAYDRPVRAEQPDALADQ